MERQKLILYKTSENNHYRTVIKTSHGRLVYLEITDSLMWHIDKYYYIDRRKGNKYYAIPKKMSTLDFEYSDLLLVFERELDRKYYGVEISADYCKLTTEYFIEAKLKDFSGKYKFLIMVGTGAIVNGVPSILRTRLKNQIHRSIYLEMRYQGDGKGFVSECYYYDRVYKQRQKVMPPTLTTILFDYTKEHILDIVNRELNMAFTHIIFITDGSVDVNNPLPLCGNI